MKQILMVALVALFAVSLTVAQDQTAQNGKKASCSTEAKSSCCTEAKGKECADMKDCPMMKGAKATKMSKASKMSAKKETKTADAKAKESK
jgi:hypothetical protein